MLVLMASPQAACPFCESETGQRVRATVFGTDFGWNLLETMLPFAVFLGVAVVIQGGWPGTGRPARGDGPDQVDRTDAPSEG